MRKILLVSDSPYATTGLGRMSKYFLKMLPEFDWYVWGFLHPNYHYRQGVYIPEYNPNEFGGQFHLESPKTYTDEQYGFEFIPEYIKGVKPDFLITSMDYHRILSIGNQIKELQMTQNFKWVNYFPIDREDYKDAEVDAFRYPDVNVCITKFGQEKILKVKPKLDIKQIYHPIDAAEFPRVSKGAVAKFKSGGEPAFKWGGVKEDTFLMATINRSFSRKDTPRLVRIFSEHLKAHPEDFAYIHGSRYTTEGMDLGKLAYECGVAPGRMSFLPKEVSEVHALDNGILNKIYRAMDLFVTVSGGEGFGFTTVEALLTATPIIAPSNTSFPELVQDNGYLLESKHMAFHHNSNTAMWPIVNIDEAKETIMHVKNNYAEAKAKALKGQQWVRDNLNLDVIAAQWREILK